MKKLILFISLFILLIFLFWNMVFLNQVIYGQTGDTSINTKVSLSSLGLGEIGLFISYDKPSAVGDGHPNYDYSGHILKMESSPYYRMSYGGRCYHDRNDNCQVPIEGKYPEENPYGRDGDHIRYAYSNNGLDWVRSLTPVIQPGKYDSPPKPPTNYDYDNRMDPTIIKWGDTYYMYYQAMVFSEEQSTLCPAPPGQTRQCDKILYATSTDLVNWTKHDQPVIINAPNDAKFMFPKAIVLDSKIWLYFGYVSDGGTTFQGPWVIQSTNPVRFNFNEKIRQQEPVEWGQHAVLWPNDPQKRIHVQVMTNWPLKSQTGYMVPTLSFSKDGIHWIHSDSGNPIDFPSVMKNKHHTFCNIATEINGGLNPLPNNLGKIETFYYCATFDGSHNVWDSDISAGKLFFILPPICSSAAPESATITSIPESFDLYAYGVNGATVVHFAVWSEHDGQDDLVWYRGNDLGGGTWKVTINPSQHPVGPTETGKINAHVYMNNDSFTNIWCGTADFNLIPGNISLLPGWNEIAWPDILGYTASSAIEDINNDCGVGTAIAISQKKENWWQNYVKNYGGGNFILQNNRNYSINVSKSCTWTP